MAAVAFFCPERCVTIRAMKKHWKTILICAALAAISIWSLLAAEEEDCDRVPRSNPALTFIPEVCR